MKLVSIPYFFSIYNTKCQLLLLHLTYAFAGRTFIYLLYGHASWQMSQPRV